MFAALVALVGCIGLFEWYRLTCRGDSVLTVGAVAVLVGAMGVAHVGYWSYAAVVLGTGLAALWLAGQLRIKQGMWAALGLLYLAIPVFSFLYIRDSYGAAHVIWLLCLIWAADIGAYFAGSMIGGAKLAPRLSPKKTWSGLIGGAVCAGAVSVLIGGYFGLGEPMVIGGIGAGLAVWSQGGDIFESGIKRRFQVKDSGRLIPGHGGVLDRIDSLVVSAPVVAALLGWSDYLRATVP